MRDPGLPARGPVPGPAAVAADGDPHLVHTLAREGPDVGIGGGGGPRPALLPAPGFRRASVQHRPAVGRRSIAVKPAQQAQNDPVGEKRLERHRLLIIERAVRVLRVGVEDDVGAPMNEIGRVEPCDFPGGEPVRDGVLDDGHPLLVLVVPKIQDVRTRAEGTARRREFGFPVRVVEEIGRLGRKKGVATKAHGKAAGRVANIAVLPEVSDAEGYSKVVVLAAPRWRGERRQLFPVDSRRSIDQPEVGLDPVDAETGRSASGFGVDILLIPSPGAAATGRTRCAARRHGRRPRRPCWRSAHPRPASTRRRCNRRQSYHRAGA